MIPSPIDTLSPFKDGRISTIAFLQLGHPLPCMIKNSNDFYCILTVNSSAQTLLAAMFNTPFATF